MVKILLWGLIIIASIAVSCGCGIALSFACYGIGRKHPNIYWLINLPLFVLPYLYEAAPRFIPSNPDNPTRSFFVPFGILLCVCLALVIAASIFDYRIVRNGIIPAKRAATFAMLIKLVHIPAYVLFFLTGIFGALGAIAFVFTFIITVFAIVADLFTIMASGTQNLVTLIALSRKGELKTRYAVLFGILGYIYCADVVAVIIFRILLGKGRLK